MAERGGEVDVDSRICSICIEDFKDPKLLPCFHTFCLDCLKQLTERVKPGEQFVCPVCRYSVTLPGTGPTGFQSNFYIAADKTRREFAEAVCDICSNPATSRCEQCAQSLCENCVQVHSSLTPTRSHSLIRLREISKYNPAVMNPEFCTKHFNERLRFHCKKCRKSICRDCKLTTHEGHSTVDLGDVVEEARKALAQLNIDFDNLKTMFLKKEQMVVDKMERFSDSMKEINNDIDRRSDELIAQINLDRKSQKMKIETCHLAKMNSLKETEKKINQDVLFLKSHIEYISALVTGGRGVDIMKAVTEMKERFAQSKAKDEKRESHHDLTIFWISQASSGYHNSSELIDIPKPVSLKVLRQFQCSANGSAADIISPIENRQAWIAVKGRSGNSSVRLFTENGMRMKEFVIHKDVYESKRDGGILEFIPRSDTEDICEEIGVFRSGVKLKHKRKTDTTNGMTCTVDVYRQCVTVVDESGRTQLTLSCACDFTPTDACWGPNGTLIIVNRGSNSLIVYTMNTSKVRSLVCGGRDGFQPSAVAWDGQDRLWIGDTCGRVFVCKIK